MTTKEEIKTTTEEEEQLNSKLAIYQQFKTKHCKPGEEISLSWTFINTGTQLWPKYTRLMSTKDSI